MARTKAPHIIILAAVFQKVPVCRAAAAESLAAAGVRAPSLLVRVFRFDGALRT